MGRPPVRNADRGGQKILRYSEKEKGIPLLQASLRRRGIAFDACLPLALFPDPCDRYQARLERSGLLPSGARHAVW